MPSCITMKAQRIAARIAGLFYLVTMASALFAQDYALGGVFRLHDPGSTARNIQASEPLFRIGIVSELATVAGVIVLIVALYVLLRPVNKGLALVALAWRLIECVLLAAAVVCPLVVLRLVSGADYLSAIPVRQLDVAAYVGLEAHSAAFNLAIFFYSLGATAFSYLLFRSRYIPRWLAGLGVIGSVMVVIGTAMHFAAPVYDSMFAGLYWIPVAVFEVVAGFWLLLLGAKISDPEDGQMS